jgi:hypothetical protein
LRKVIPKKIKARFEHYPREKFRDQHIINDTFKERRRLEREEGSLQRWGRTVLNVPGFGIDGSHWDVLDVQRYTLRD